MNQINGGDRDGEKWEAKMEYKQPIFYKREEGFSPELQEEICRDAKSKCYDWWVDHLPGMARKKIDLPFEEVLKYLYTESVHFVIIHRRGYDGSYLEIGFCTLALRNILPSTKVEVKGDLYLWILLKDEYIPYFIEKYNLLER